MKVSKMFFCFLCTALITGATYTIGLIADPVSASDVAKDKLYTEFIGDAPKVSAIAQSLPYPANYSYSSIELLTDEEPYELQVFLKGEGSFDPEVFAECADQAFERIGNLSIIMFLSEESGEVLAVHSEPEDLIWKEKSLSQDSNWDANITDDSISIIGGADGPTSIFLAGKLGGESQRKQCNYYLTIGEDNVYKIDINLRGQFCHYLDLSDGEPLNKGDQIEVIALRNVKSLRGLEITAYDKDGNVLMNGKVSDIGRNSGVVELSIDDWLLSQNKQEGMQVCIDGIDYFGIGLTLTDEPDENTIEYVEIPVDDGDAMITAFARLEEGNMIACRIDDVWYKFHSMEALASSVIDLEE